MSQNEMFDESLERIYQCSKQDDRARWRSMTTWAYAVSSYWTEHPRKARAFYGSR